MAGDRANAFRDAQFRHVDRLDLVNDRIEARMPRLSRFLQTPRG
jgi:hypothetical protein